MNFLQSRTLFDLSHSALGLQPLAAMLLSGYGLR